jgi:HK97 family phage prohead protease
MQLEVGTAFPILETKALNDAWEVSGYISTYGEVDHVDDVVMPGCFDATLSSGQRTRFLYMHDPEQVLGVPLSLKSDAKGVFGQFRISKTRLGEDVHRLLLDGALDSFSIGFRTKQSEMDSSGKRLLREVALHESSIVSMPANEKALVMNVKQLMFDPAEMPFEEFWAHATEALTKSVAQTQSLDARRREEGRKLTERHLATLQDALSALEGAQTELKAVLAAVLADPPPPEPLAPAPPAPTENAKAVSPLFLKVALRKRQYAIAHPGLFPPKTSAPLPPLEIPPQ